MGDLVLEFEPYSGQDLPVPQPWVVQNDGTILNPHTKSLGLRLVGIKNDMAVVDLSGVEYTFPQRITKIRKNV